MKKKPTLSAYILTGNNEEVIGRCLDSLKRVEEIIVIDGGSTDKTIGICKRYKNVKVYTNAWPGFPKQRNFALSKCTGDWILLVDSDMEAPPQLLDEIYETIAHPAYEAYFISFYNLFLGTYPLIGGEWYPHWCEMLFKNSPALHYDEKRIVHEGGPYTGEYGYLKNFIIHHNYPTINSWIKKMIFYTDLDAEKLKTHLIFGRFRVRVNPKNKISVLWFILWYPFIHSMWLFFWRKGYKSGIPGLIYCIMSTFYYFIVFVKYWDTLCNEHHDKPTKEDALNKGFTLIQKKGRA